MTHVCRYWRESIVSTPGNWALISNERIGLTRSSLERCKAVPLELRLSVFQARIDAGFFDLITPYIQNTEILRIDYISLQKTLPSFPRSMPNLRSLSLLSGHLNWNRSTDPFGPLKWLAPALTHLSLTRVPLCPSFLRLRSLADLTLHNYQLDLHLDTLLDFLEEKTSLERVTLRIAFNQPSFRVSRRRVAIRNRLLSLSIRSIDAMDSEALISNIALQRGALLELTLYDRNAGSNAVLSVISMTHLSNLESPTHIQYYPDKRGVRLFGPNGSFSFTCGWWFLEEPFAEFPLLPLTNVQTFYLVRRALGVGDPPEDSIVFPPSSLPALETLAVEHDVAVSHLFSALFSDPSSSPSLNTLAFLDCDLDEGFMKELTRFASNRKNTSARLYRVVIVNSKGCIPSPASLDGLGKHVPVVDVRVCGRLPADLV